MPEKMGFASSETEESVSKLEGFITASAENYRREGVPVGKDGRVLMEAYKKIYPDVDADIQRNHEWEEKWKEENPREVDSERQESDGEKLEMLAYALCVKYFGKDFVIARSSKHDDRKNKVDTLILDRTTGNLICAFDEVGDTSGTRYEEKNRSVQEHNLQGGAELKYGFKIIEHQNKKVVVPAGNKNLPLFYIALAKDRIEKGIIEFNPTMEGGSEYERKLFQYIIGTISIQIKGLQLYNKRLNPNMKKQLAEFQETIKQFE